ncbi:MAG: hypothetical protein ACTSPF_14410, partial [Candidatus Heimdallarchaeaceae archaeon]
MIVGNNRKRIKLQGEVEEEILFFVEEQAKQAMIIAYEEYTELTREQYSKRLNCSFPATTFDLEELTNLPSSTLSDYMNRLRLQKKIKSRKAKWFKREKRFYIPYHFQWPEYIFKTCGSCENWNRFTSRCTFFQELTAKGYPTDRIRLLAKLPAKMLACKWFISRTKRALLTFRTIQDFADKAGDTELWFDSSERDSYYITSPKAAMVAYRCIFCYKPMINLGWGMIPNIGSALLICDYCGSFYKLWFNKSEGVYGVKAAQEKYHEYSKNYQIYTGGEEPPLYKESGKYGISLGSFSEEEDLHKEMALLTTYNLYAHYNQLDFLVVNNKEEYDILKRRLGRDFPQLMIIQREEQLESIEPTRQQIGAVGLLRETEVMNIDYALSLLRSRRNALEQITEYSNKKLLSRALEESNKRIHELLRRKKQGILLGSKEWNQIDGFVANPQWEVLKRIFEENKFDFPNRRKARHTERDPIRPYGKFFSFSKGNTAVNALFGKIDTIFIKKCIEHQFPWEGLPGICHGKTTGGRYGFLLDNEEGFKQATIPAMVTAVVEEKITPDMIISQRLRKRIPQYYLVPESEGDEVLDKECQRVLKGSSLTWMNGKEQKCSLDKAMEYQVLSLKQLLSDVIWKEEMLISNKKKQYNAWCVGGRNRWTELPWKEQQRIRKAIQQVV